MNRRTIGTLLAVLALSVAPSAAAAPDAQGEREIAYLIDYVAASACRFVRNGTEHPGPDASKHLATKYGRVRGRVDSADSFIANVASGSSASGEPYLVRCGTQQTTTRVWLTAELARYRRDTAAKK